MSPLTHHSWTFAKYRQVSPFRGRLLFLLRSMSPCVAQYCGSMGQNKGSRQFRWEVTRHSTCGCGDPIRRVGECRTTSPRASLPHSRCRLLAPHVAACRRVSAITRAAYASAGALLPALRLRSAAVPRRASGFNKGDNKAATTEHLPPPAAARFLHVPMRHCFQHAYALIGGEKAKGVGAELESPHGGSDFIGRSGHPGVLCYRNVMYVTRMSILKSILKSILRWHP